MSPTLFFVNDEPLSPAAQEQLFYLLGARKCFSRMAFPTELDGHRVRAVDGAMQQPNAIIIEWAGDRYRKWSFLIEGDDPEDCLPTNDETCLAYLNRMGVPR